MSRPLRFGQLGTTYVLTHGGSVVHRAACWHARAWEVMFGRAMPWHWAERQDPLKIASFIDFHDLHTCRACRPFDPPLRGRRRA